MVERSLRQKPEIREALQVEGRPLSIEEAFAVAANAIEGLVIATVFRSIAP